MKIHLIFHSSLDGLIPTKIIFLLREFLHRRKNSFDKDQSMLHPLRHTTIISPSMPILGHQKHPRRQDYPIDENESIVYIESIVFQKNLSFVCFFLVVVFDFILYALIVVHRTSSSLLFFE